VKAAPREQSGFVLLAVLLLAVLMTSIVLTYARHSIVAADTNSANLRAQAAEQAAGDGFVWAKQKLLAAPAGTSATLRVNGEAGVTVSVGAGSGKRAISVEATGPGTTQQFEATAETYATTSGNLPKVTPTGRVAVNAAAAKTEVNGAVTYANTEITGILYLRYGSSVTLRDVIITGGIVSEAALLGAWTPAQATQITIDGGLLIETGSVVPGCAILAPDATITGTGNDRVQIEGVVVAASLTLPGSGSLHAQIATTTTPVLSVNIDQPGSGRAPRTWPDVLDTAAEGVSRVVFLRSDPTPSERDAIEGYAFPARGS